MQGRKMRPDRQTGLRLYPVDGHVGSKVHMVEENSYKQ